MCRYTAGVDTSMVMCTRTLHCRLRQLDGDVYTYVAEETEKRIDGCLAPLELGLRLGAQVVITLRIGTLRIF